MTTSLRTLLNCGVLTLAATVTTGCFDNTLDSVSIPNVAWNTMVTGLASPYADLQVLTIGDNITAEFLPDSTGPLLYCGNPTDSGHALADPSVGCPPGYQAYGTRYWYVLSISLNRPAFQAGGIQLTSETGGGTVESISFAVNATLEPKELKVVAGLSEGTIPLPRTPTQPGEDAYVYFVDNYTSMGFSPHEPAFATATYGDPNYPEVACTADYQGGTDVILFNTATATAGSYNCGVAISLSLTPPYSSVGQCITESLEQNCKKQGLKGKARAACNAAQTGNCHAIFHSPKA